MVPPAAVLREVERAVERDVKVVYVVTGGLGETGTAAGHEIERRLAEISSRSGVPIVGPNGQGIVNAHLPLCGQMFFTMPPAGPIALITQSGNIGVVLSTLAVHSGIGLSKVVSTGNAACLDIADFVEYLGADPETQVLLLYVEGTKEGRRLLAAIEAVSRHKPVVLMKAGNSAAGGRAATSHSAAMASDARVFVDACRAAGAIVTSSFSEMWDAASILSSLPPPRGRRVGILTLGGGLGVITADLVAEAGFEVTPLPDSLRAALDVILPPRWSRGNPIDLAATEGPTTIVDALRLMIEAQCFDAIVYVGFGQNDVARYMIQHGTLADAFPMPQVCDVLHRMDLDVGELVRQVVTERQLPIVCIAEAVVLAREIPDAAIAVHARHGHPTFTTPERGIRALGHLVDYHGGTRQGAS
jgi:acetyl-CoA synthetase (ADP-forming)